jgi:hypothetical protein
VSERAIQLFEGKNNHVEWIKGGEAACATLQLSEDDLADRCDELHELFVSEDN